MGSGIVRSRPDVARFVKWAQDALEILSPYVGSWGPPSKDEQCKKWERKQGRNCFVILSNLLVLIVRNDHTIVSLPFVGCSRNESNKLPENNLQINV